MDANQVEDRLIDFAVRIIKLADALPRSGTSPAPNYAEARGAESPADFVHKLKVALKELNETSVWLRMVSRAELMNTNRLAELVDENTQLCRILNASIRTAKQSNDK